MFDKEFDESLWCILEADKEKRFQIIEFLKGIPNELFESISEVLYFININNLKDYCYGQEIISEDGFIYKYNLFIEEQEKTLTLSRELLFPKFNNSYINFAEELNLVKEFPLYNPEIGEEFHIGNFCNAIHTSGNVDTDKLSKNEFFMPFMNFENGVAKDVGKELELEIEYSLSKNILGHSVMRMDCDQRKIDNIPIDMDILPSKITMDYIEKRYGSEVKKKKKRKNN